jgi:LPS export ABC transporter protein LptC
VVQSVREQRAQALQDIGLNQASRADQRIQNFRRVSIREGKKEWEIAAREARYFAAEGMVVVYGPEVAFYLGQGEVVSVQGEEGRLYLQGQEVERIVLKGKLEVRFGDFLIATEEAIYSQPQDRIFSPGAVEITGRGLTIKGEGCEVVVADKKFILARNVQTVVVPRLKEATVSGPLDKARDRFIPQPG